MVRGRPAETVRVFVSEHARWTDRPTFGFSDDNSNRVM